MKIEFSDTEYRFNHGAAPRGRGFWGFFFSTSGRFAGTNDTLWFASGECTLGEAKKLAKIEAAHRFPNVSHVYIKVAP